MQILKEHKKKRVLNCCSLSLINKGFVKNVARKTSIKTNPDIVR